MTVNLSALAGAGQQFFDNSGVILSGGKLYSYAAGTSTPQATYTSASGATAHTNPIVLDSAGRVATGEIWLTAGSNYKFALYTSLNVLITTWDNITGINGTGIASNASNVQYDPAGTGAVSTTVQAKLRQYISVKDFGATGDGSTDDAAAVQLALNVAGNIYFPAGTYSIGTTLNVLSNTQVLLDQNATVIAKSTLSGKLFSVSGKTNVKITGGIFNGNKASATSSTDVIYIYDSYYVWVDNTTIQNGKSHNIFIEGPSSGSVSKNIYIQNNSLSASAGPCITFTYTTNILIENNQIFSNATGLTSGQSSQIAIVGNTFYSNTNDGCAVGDSCSYVSVTGNISHDNGAEGINIDGVNNGVITGNTSYNNLIGITVWNRSPGTATSKRNVVSSNTVSNCTQYGILVADTTVFTLVEGNSVNNCGRDGIFLTSVNNAIIRDNVTNNNTFSGIYASATIGSTIQNNFSAYNTLYGIHLVSGTGLGRTTVTGNTLAANAGGYGVYDNSNGSNNVISNNFFTDESSPVVQTTSIYANDNGVVIENNRTLIGTAGLPTVAGGTARQILNSWQYLTAAPSTGTWAVGDIVYNSAPASAGYIGFVCTVAGTPGTWKSFGLIT
jgi:parallel beta-helix repeat protein